MYFTGTKSYLRLHTELTAKNKLKVICKLYPVYVSFWWTVIVPKNLL